MSFSTCRKSPLNGASLTTPAVGLLVALLCCAAVEIDNGLEGEPNVECLSDQIVVELRTRNVFNGNVYAKGYFEKPECTMGATSTNAVAIALSFNGDCGVGRRRSVNPGGMSMEVTVVIMFHTTFLTKIDRAFRVSCFFMEATKQLTQSFEVSMLTTQSLTAATDMPACVYDVLAGGADGEPIRFARIGDQVYHRWMCTGADAELYCMTVHSCSVEDGQGTSRLLLDSLGCALDPFLLQNLDYRGPLLAGREAHIFKFADKPSIFFNCEIRLESRTNDGCLRTSDSCVDESPGTVVTDRSIDEPSETVAAPANQTVAAPANQTVESAANQTAADDFPQPDDFPPPRRSRRQSDAVELDLSSSRIDIFDIFPDDGESSADLLPLESDSGAACASWPLVALLAAALFSATVAAAAAAASYALRKPNLFEQTCAFD